MNLYDRPTTNDHYDKPRKSFKYNTLDSLRGVKDKGGDCLRDDVCMVCEHHTDSEISSPEHGGVIAGRETYLNSYTNVRTSDMKNAHKYLTTSI